MHALQRPSVSMAVPVSHKNITAVTHSPSHVCAYLSPTHHGVGVQEHLQATNRLRARPMHIPLSSLRVIHLQASDAIGTASEARSRARGAWRTSLAGTFCAHTAHVYPKYEGVRWKTSDEALAAGDGDAPSGEEVGDAPALTPVRTAVTIQTTFGMRA